MIEFTTAKTYKRSDVVELLMRTVREEFVREEPGTRLKHLVVENGEVIGREHEPCTIRICHYVGLVDGVAMKVRVDKNGTEDWDRRHEALARKVIARKMLELMEGP